MSDVKVLGRIGTELELTTTVNNVPKLKFSVAKTKLVNGKKKTTWFSLVAYDKTADTIAKFFKKGDRILFEADYNNYSYDKADGSGKGYTHEFVVNSFEFIESKSSSAPTMDISPQTTQEPAQYNTGYAVGQY